MNQWYDDSRARYNVIAIPVIWLAVMLSLMIHGIALYEWLPRMEPLSIGEPEPEKEGARLVARLAPPLVVAPAPQPALPPPPAATPAPPEPAPKPPPPAPPRPRPPALLTPRPPAPTPLPPPILVPESPGPRIVLPAPAPPTLAVPAPPPPAPSAKPLEQDLTSYIAARRRERGEAAPTDSRSTTPGTLSAEEDIARRDRIVAQNLASLNAQTLGDAPKNTGGVFQITEIGYDYAEFTFYGWHRDIRRRATQRIEVRKGDASDIRVAVVRKMIDIIRRYEQEDFSWRSNRLGHDVTLSARVADSAALESFLMRDFNFQ